MSHGYIRAQMIRFLLTLLAFVTGLAVLNGPAEARVTSIAGSEVGAVAGVAEAASAHMAQTRAVRTPTYRRVLIIAPLYFAAPMPVTGARTGIDRARE